MTFTRSLWIYLFIFIIFTVNKVNCQSAIQDFLNRICIQNPNLEGCRRDTNSGVSTTTGRPSFFPTQPSGPTQSGCFPNEKKCPQLQNKCIPNEVDCNIINSGITCRIPQNFGAETQILLCGDDSPVGVRCGIGGTVPVLTVILVQCQGFNDIHPRPISALNVLVGPGDKGGAGIYRCSETGSWEPRLQSPFLRQLTESCKNAGCGRVPHPSDDTPIHRRWSWVRGIYKDQGLHCTGTLVSPNALVTAAHCVVRSLVSNVAENTDRFQIEVPGPNVDNPSIRTAPNRIEIHPRYSFNNGRYQNDLAIMFFDSPGIQHVPTVCITDRLYNQRIGKSQVVFNLQNGQQQQPQAPVWKQLKATWDNTCINTSPVNNPGSCSNTLQVQFSQFCASHNGASLSKGSSGGPYLAEVGEGVEEVWVLMGVLSVSSQVTDGDTCFHEHSVYGQVSDNSRWLKKCVFENRCFI